MSTPTPSAPPLDWNTQRERRTNFYPKAPARKDKAKSTPRPVCSKYFDKIGYQEHEGNTLHLYRHKKNKLRVVLAPKSSNNVCAMSVCFLVGSKAETLSTTGSVSSNSFVNPACTLVFSHFVIIASSPGTHFRTRVVQRVRELFKGKRQIYMVCAWQQGSEIECFYI